MDVDLKHGMGTAVSEVRSCGLVRGGQSGEGGRSELCSGVDGEPQLVRRMHKMQSCGEESQKSTENEGGRIG